ncbi:ATP-binding cassette domain-containing protein [Streptomyces diacarni]|uniref:ABC transporter ATP-binding protein n=1 Tax=Streptomyces diacarni TaxID=2800381 RepID=UPI0033EE95DD
MPLELASCTFAYQRRTRPVLEDFTYELPRGLTILLGPNGAGKSTLLKIAASVLRPQTGTVSAHGMPAHSADFRRTVGWMPQNITAMTAHTAREQVAYVGWLKGMPRRQAWEASASALAQVELSDQANTKARRLSGGQLRRLGVAAALVHGARILLLDEPTAGMDPRQRRVFRDVLANLTGHVDILLSTHDVADLAEEAHHVTLLDAGHITYTGTTTGFLSHAPEGTAPGRAAEAAYNALSRTPASL